MDKTVLVTGASSGIGHAVALHLAGLGYTVLATVRKQADADQLSRLGIPPLIPVCPLDLTSQEDITRVVEGIRQRIQHTAIPPLYSVILVAGGGHISPIELMDITHFRAELEKRLVGNVALLQGLIPELRITKGRIIWIATPGLFPVPYVADIHVPDFAVNYLARTLNLELLPDGIQNILVRCGGIETRAPERSETNILAQIREYSHGSVDHYADRLQALEKSLNSFARKRTPPLKVAQLIALILQTRRPKTRYQVGHQSRLGALLEKLPQSWVDYIMMKREQNG